MPEGADGRDWGVWLALASTVGIVVGSPRWRCAMNGSSPAGAYTDLTGRPMTPPAEIETFPAPRP